MEVAARIRHLSLLELDGDATIDQVRSAYLTQVAKHHPNLSSPSATETIMNLTKSYIHLTEGEPDLQKGKSELGPECAVEMVESVHPGSVKPKNGKSSGSPGRDSALISIGHSHARFSWNGSPPGSVHTVEFSPKQAEGRSRWTKSYEGTDFSHRIVGLQPETSYVVRITSQHTDLNGVAYTKTISNDIRTCDVQSAEEQSSDHDEGNMTEISNEPKESALESPTVNLEKYPIQKDLVPSNDKTNRRTGQICRYFLNGGKCKKGITCNFSHDAAGLPSDFERREYALYCWNAQLGERERQMVCRLSDLAQYEHDLSCRELEVMQREQIVACNHATLLQREEWVTSATNELTQFEQQLEHERQRLHGEVSEAPPKTLPRSGRALKTNEQIVKFWMASRAQSR